jgi:hypothetical protein
MGLSTELRRLLRGKVDLRTIKLETKWRIRVARERRRERSMLAQLNQQPAQFWEEFARMSSHELAAHFQSRVSPSFFPGFASASTTAELQKTLFPDQTEQLLVAANRIVEHHSWPLLGLAEKCFGVGEIDWHRDPLSDKQWPLSYHADINLFRNDGSDARVVWELSRLGHFITLGRAYAITSDDRFSDEFFSQLASWRAQNPVGRGVNWTCAMEVSLRAMNLLAAFALFRHAPQMSKEALDLLTMLDQHGAHIERNLEFSYLGNSNHYLSDLVGLLWLGLMLPELRAGNRWLKFGAREMLREMDKQILPDGAHSECSTGYHRYVLELLLYSLLLVRFNEERVNKEYWSELWPKLRSMLEYVRVYLRPDGRAPLIGDSDSGQVLPIVHRTGDDHAYVLALGATVLNDSKFKIPGSGLSEELLWIFGATGVRDYQALREGPPAKSTAFRDVRTFVLREDDAYCLLNASGVGLNGRGSHRHNDALSIEVSACGTAFIVDPGTYVYTADLHERQLFRSTAYHSTVQVDEREQRTTVEGKPFRIGDEGNGNAVFMKDDEERSELMSWHTHDQEKLSHQRYVVFYRRDKYWLIQDEITGGGIHEFSFRFHFAPGLEVTLGSNGIVEASHHETGAKLLIMAEGFNARPKLEARFSSRDYGAKLASVSACWSRRAAPPFRVNFTIVPVSPDDCEDERILTAMVSSR